MSNTFFEDLSIAEKFGNGAVVETAKRITKEWFSDVVMFSGFVIALNQKIWSLYKTNEKLTELYTELYYKYHYLALDNYKGDNASLYFELTD